jgi:uncharacterized protein
VPEAAQSKFFGESIPLNKPTSPSEAAEFHVRRALAALGVARVQELHYLQDTARAEDGRAALRAMVEKGEAVRISIPDVKTPLYALRSSLDLFTPIQRHAVRFLSPFDNLAIQRKRLEWLFEFDYVVEIYVPAAKRKYGYFVLPIQWGDRLIGRMDAKADRHNPVNQEVASSERCPKR